MCPHNPPLAIFEPLAEAAATWRALDYHAGGGIGSGPPAAMAARAETFAIASPPADWDGVWQRQGK